MGPFLDKPLMELNEEDGENDMCIWGLCSMQGWRASQEDAHFVYELTQPWDNKKAMCFGVFDGHGGREISRLVVDKFRSTLEGLEQWKKGEIQEALTETFRIIDWDIIKNMDDKDKEKTEVKLEQGSTGCVVYFNSEKIICANTGDSRATLAAENEEGVIETTELSTDHKPMDKLEKQRIYKAKHWVEDSTKRVDGNLAVARAFGDHQFKDYGKGDWSEQAVTAAPEIREFARSEDQTFFLNACDGIWDTINNEDCMEKIDQLNNDKKMLVGKKKHKIVAKLMQDGVAKDTKGTGIGTDNMTGIVVFFKK